MVLAIEKWSPGGSGHPKAFPGGSGHQKVFARWFWLSKSGRLMVLAVQKCSPDGSGYPKVLARWFLHLKSVDFVKFLDFDMELKQIFPILL